MGVHSRLVSEEATSSFPFRGAGGMDDVVVFDRALSVDRGSWSISVVVSRPLR